MATKVKRIRTDIIPDNFISSLSTDLTEEERSMIDIKDGIQNGIFGLEGCRVTEPKLWEER